MQVAATLDPGSPTNTGRRPDTPAPESGSPLVARLLDLVSAAAYLGVSPWSLREWEALGVIRRVRVPLPVTQKRRGGELRKLLFDRHDLDRLVEAWKDPPPTTI
jgi:hypothetical protein